MPTTKGMPDPARQSAGGAASAGGNDFQARVAAWWLGLALLRVHGRGTPFSFPQKSLPVRVAAQTGDATDDVRVSFDSGHELYAQCKTGLSVSAEWSPTGGKKSKFAETWIQFYQQFASAGRNGLLALVLVVEEASGPIRNLQQVLQRFRTSPAGTTLDAGAVAVTKEERVVARKVLALFTAFAKDQNLADFARHQDRLLRHVYVHVLRVGDGERDWLDLDALLQFGVLTDPGDSSHALRILADAGHALHKNRASLEYTGLSKRMADAGITLKDALDLGREWEALYRKSERAQDEVVDTLGRGFRLQRPGEIDSLRSTLQENRCVVVLGASGSGKSVVVKDWARTGAAEARRIVWLSGAELDGIDPAHLRQSLGLKTEVDVIFQTETRPAFLVIDGVDRCFASEGFACLRHLLAACRLQDPESAWHLVLTCDELEWGRVVRAFEDRHVEVPAFVPLLVGPINTTAISQMLARFPELARLVSQREVWKLFENLKILDLIVNRLESGASLDASGWVSELQVADWWWQKEFADSAQSASRTVAVLELAKKQGDNSRAAVALGELSEQARGAADVLHRNRCWKLVADSRVDFAHDLFGDWSRSRVLRSEAENSRNFREFLLARASLPLWHRAIRLYAARLLESEEGLARWQELFHSVAGGPMENVLVGDILLESVVFGSRLEVVMEALWPALSADGGRLLRRFLNRFLYAASAPHPGVLRRFGHRPDLLPLAKTYHRYPLWGHWVALVRFLAAHARFVAEAAPLEVARMSELCFRHIGKDTPGRAEMALLAVTAAERLSYQEEHDHSPRREPRVARAYGAALHAFAEQPERVRELALQLSGRKQRQVKPEEKTLVPPHQRWRRPSLVEANASGVQNAASDSSDSLGGKRRVA